MTYLKDGTCQVYFDYLINVMVIENFNAAMSVNGLFLKLQAKVPKAFIGLMARAYIRGCTGEFSKKEILSNKKNFVLNY